MRNWVLQMLNNLLRNWVVQMLNNLLRNWVVQILDNILRNWVVQMLDNLLRNPVFCSTHLRISLCVRRLVSVKSDLDPMHAFKASGGTQIWLHSFLTSTLDGGEL
jgi:hypothetical protein